ncbi:hypothetical protein [Stenotrophomonas sp. NPDC077659]|uniref:hypothetical protein n=1 Tax=Stenotrophomonas sp. NPDC077659 TaxID=3390694 RepID=UPI003D0292FD
MSRIGTDVFPAAAPRAGTPAEDVSDVAAGIERLSNAGAGVLPGVTRKKARPVAVSRAGPRLVDVVSTSLLAVAVSVVAPPRQGRAARRLRADPHGPMPTK